MKIETRPKTAAFVDTGLEWCGYKMFILMPVELGAPTPDMVIPEFKKDMKMLTSRITLDDFYKYQRDVLNRIVNGFALVN